jgi:hypothetical protein
VVSVLASGVVDRRFIEPTIYSSRGKHANYYINDEPTIYSTGCEQADYYINDEPTIYST